MKKTSQTIVFFGSGPVAAESLRLLQQHCKIEAIVTKPSTELEMKAVSSDTPIYTVSSKSELDNLIQEKTFVSSYGILIDFGIIVSQNVINTFEKGIINSHFSLLPEWRGADPITFSILSGQKTTGVSLMLLVEAMDEGPILAFGLQDITPTTTGPELTKSLIYLSDGLLKTEIPRYVAGTTKLIAQEDISNKMMLDYPNTPTYSRKLTKQDGILDFNKSAKELEAEVRAFIEWPKSRTEIAGKDVVVLKATADDDYTGDIGTIFKTESKQIGIQTKQGALIIEELKPAGKNAMPAKSFLAGYGNKL